MRIKPTLNKATLRVFTIAITTVICTLVILSAVFPFPEGTQWNFLSIGTSQRAAYTQGSGNWTINGSAVYWEDDKAYLSATPHTLTSSGWVEFDLESKVWSGEIDVVWGFPSDISIKPKNPQRWALNVSHELQRQIIVEKPYTFNVCNISTWTQLTWNGIEPDIGNHNNTNIYNVTAADWQCTGKSSNYTSYIIAFNNYVGNKQHAIFYGNRDTTETQTYYEYYDDWVFWNPPPMQTVNYTYAGVDQWHIVKCDQTIQAGKRYKIRAWIDEPIQLGPWSCKYVWAVKPSAETIQQAKENGHLYLLDPWLSGGWNYRVKLTADHTDITNNGLTNFPTLLYLSNSSGYNTDNISFIFNELQSDANRFKIAVTTLDGETQCYVEVEKWNDANEQAWLWAKAPSVSNTTDTDFYLYYDSTHADNTAYIGDTNSTPAENVWDSNFVFVSHMRDDPDTSHIRDSTPNSNDGTKGAAAEPAVTTSGKIDSAQSFDGSNDRVNLDVGSKTLLDFTSSPFSVEAWVYRAATGGTTQYLIEKAATLVYGWRVYMTSAGIFGLQTIQSGVAQQTSSYADIAVGSWYHIVVTRSGASALIYINSTDRTQTPGTHIDPASSAVMAAVISRSTNAFNGTIDEVRISDIARSAAWIKATYETERDHLLDWGSEESATPTVTTQAATDILSTSCIGNGNITAIGEGNCTTRGFCYMVGTSGDPTTANSTVYDTGSYETGTYSKSIIELSSGTSYRVRAYAINSAGTGYGDSVTVLTIPAAPTNVSATDGNYTDKVAITWTKSAGATGYKVYEDSNLLDTLGDVATYDDNAAPAPIITAGTASASDESSTAYVTLAITGESVANGTSRTYKVVAFNPTGDSADSNTDTGYRGHGTLAYQWQRSSIDSDVDYSNIDGATSSSHNDTEAPAPTVTAGNVTASDGTSIDYVTLTLANQTGNVGAGRYYKCILDAEGAISQNSTSNRGYRGTDTLSLQWLRSAADSDDTYSNIVGAITNPHNDTNGVVAPDGRYYKCLVSMSGAVSQNSTVDRGYKLPIYLPTVISYNATDTTYFSAILHGEITSTGNNNSFTRGFEWGYFSGNYSANWTEDGSFGLGTFDKEITGLTQDKDVFWRAFATNSAGTNYSEERSFNTTEWMTLPLAPTDFIITQIGADSINITWTKGLGANIIIVRGSTNGYPWSVLDGTAIYSGNGTYVEVDSLDLTATTYYYRAWSQNDYGTSTGYDQDSIGHEAGEGVDASAVIDYIRNLLEGPMGISSMFFVLGLVGFAFWKKGWIRVILSLAIIAWGVFAMRFDVKVGVPLTSLGLLLFIMGIFNIARNKEDKEST